jgi:4-aminobutyrate aminotransferase-like enzyme
VIRFFAAPKGSVWRIAPPLTVTTDEIDRALKDGLDAVARAG